MFGASSGSLGAAATELFRPHAIHVAHPFSYTAGRTVSAPGASAAPHHPLRAEHPVAAPAEAEGFQRVSVRQGRFIRYMLYVLVDLTVLNLFVQYWDRIVIDSFSISLFTAALLQVLLKATLAVEHRIADHFRPRPGTGATIKRILATWAVLFGSKFVILETVDVVFGDHVDLGGLVPFIVLAMALLAAETILSRIYDALA